MHVWIGTSGYSYPDWVGPFYPPGTRPSRMLAHYGRAFPLVELNFTFYRPPTEKMLTRLTHHTPHGFQFLVKLPRLLSHERQLAGLVPFRDAVAGLHERGRLLGLLCQLPQAAHHDQSSLAWLEVLARELGNYRLAVEFRHRSWHQPAISAWLEERGVELVSVDAPDLPAIYPSGLVQTGSRIYVRFHSRKAANWYLTDKDRYDFDYADPMLREWIDALRRASGLASHALLLFNNCHRAQAAANAQRMRELLEKFAPELPVVQAFGPPANEPRQQLLFEDME
ncbi:MAG TPA: DUF72 domain-containing protein [Gemmataceae bacterium]|nr:DUF72 domain-containing protein [Gemmataceae bacterium]